MQSKIFMAGAVLSAVTAVAGNNVATISANPSQASAIESDVSSYFSSLAGQAQFTSVIQAMEMDLDSDTFYSVTADPGDFFAQFATITSMPPSLTALPTDVQSYLSSVGQAEASIINKDTGNDAGHSNVGVKAAGALVAAIVAVVALL